MEKIAIPIWENRISPVLDTASRLMLVETEDGHEVSREIVSIPSDRVPDRIRLITQLNINTVLCGAVSRPFHALLGQSGIKVIPFVSGTVDDILRAYLAGNVNTERFLLPGCGRARRRCGQQGGRVGRRCRRNGPGLHQEDKE